jgi:hypothetical protein
VLKKFSWDNNKLDSTSIGQKGKWLIAYGKNNLLFRKKALK